MSLFKGIVALTKSQYDSLATKDQDTLYCTTDELPENTSNKVTSISIASTDAQYPSAKCLYDGLAGKQGAATKQTATINVADWNNKMATCSIPGLREYGDTTQLVQCMFTSSQVMFSAKPWFNCAEAGTLIIMCQGDVPVEAVTVVVIMQEV